jgi:hypothetical protein
VHRRWIIFVGGQFEVFHENCPGGELPFVGWRKRNLLTDRVMSAIVGHSNPSILGRRI